jgi:hypothetical protein
MVVLNSHGEIADFLDINQFIISRSAYECVAYAAVLCKYCGEPGHGPSGAVLQASNLAQYWYGREEGNTLASNTNGMSLDAMYSMLHGMGLSYHIAPPTLQYVKAWLAVGYPVMLCGAETGMVDIGLGDVVPYGWTPSGNHCIVASGVTADGNLLVHDTANIGPTGVRTGPRTYDANRLSLVSATAIAVPWLAALPAEYDPTKEVDVTITLSTPGVSQFFEAVPGGWTCLQTGKIIQGAILAEYARYGGSGLCGLTWLGLPKSSEIPVEQLSSDPKLAGHNIRIQFFERGVLAYDVDHILDNPPGAGAVYTVHLYGGVGSDPLIAQLEKQLVALQKQIAPLAIPSTLIADMQLIKITSAKY